MAVTIEAAYRAAAEVIKINGRLHARLRSLEADHVGLEQAYDIACSKEDQLRVRLKEAEDFGADRCDEIRRQAAVIDTLRKLLGPCRSFGWYAPDGTIVKDPTIAPRVHNRMCGNERPCSEHDKV